MTEAETTALLPAGLRDILPPDAGFAADLVQRLRACFAGYGYEWVDPPLVEFEDTLLDGAGAAMAPETFRLMDPVSQRMMGVRTDITVQVARLATTRLAKSPRPLRLAYAGDVLRVKGKQLRPERQFTQIGAELIGSDAAAADVEAVTMAVDGLTRLGVQKLSVDLTVPALVPHVLASLEAPARAAAAVRAALDRKDAAGVDVAATPLGSGATVFQHLLRATGPAEPALAQLARITLPEAARREAERLDLVARALMAALPNTAFTVDPVENRGLEYHTGVSFTIFRVGVRGELGLGGRYLAGRAGNTRPQEPATGLTLYLDPILRALPEPKMPERVYVPHGTAPEIAAGLRDNGHRAVAGLAPEPDGDAAAEARRLGCSHLWHDGKIVAAQG
ncbi:MAG: ATP phosphoribosyltransferase regulatory subunit [Rhodospirillaceae bacterium]|nr:ATP phosphoribosyltransferase regulatory subunit [Rhodospirillaceae bacterium]